MELQKSLEFLNRRLVFLKVFGFSSITITGKKSVTKPFDFLCFVLALSLGVFCCYLAATNRKEFDTSSSEIANYGNYIMLIALIFVSMVAMIFSFIFRHKIWSMNVKILEMDEKVSSLKFFQIRIQLTIFFICQLKEIESHFDYMTVLKRNFLISFAFMSTIWPMTGFYYYMDRSLLKAPLVLYAALYFTFCIGSVSAYTLAIFYRLQSINEVLQRKYLQSKAGKTIGKIRDEKVFMVSMKVYSSLMDVCDDVNLCYGFSTMLGFGTVFFYTIFTSFTAYMDIIGSKKLLPATISSVSFCIYYNIYLSLVIFSCMVLIKIVGTF